MKPCKTSLAIHTDISDKRIANAKDFMKTKYESTFDVSPHVTHLLFPMFENSFNMLLPELEEHITKLTKFDVTLGKVEAEEKRKFFTLPINDIKLVKLHKELLELSGPYRKGAMRIKDIKRLSEGYYEKKLSQYLKKYGYPRVLDLNKPHITLGSCEVENCNLEKIKKELNKIIGNNANNTIPISKIIVTLHTNTKVQSDMEILFEKEFNLK